MNTERSLDEINAHRHPVVANPEHYRVKRIKYEEDIDDEHRFLQICLAHVETGNICKLKFANPSFNGSPFQGLWDATGLYIMTTAHLAWDRQQRVEIGDWDGGPPLLWASEVEKAEE